MDVFVCLCISVIYVQIIFPIKINSCYAVKGAANVIYTFISKVVGSNSNKLLSPLIKT